MIDLSAGVYCRIAELRLTEARSKCERLVAQDNIEYVASFAQTASLIWDAAMDVLSALVMLEGERTYWKVVRPPPICKSETARKSLPLLASLVVAA